MQISGKKYELLVFFTPQTKTAENDHASFSQINELIGCQISADFFGI